MNETSEMNSKPNARQADELNAIIEVRRLQPKAVTSDEAVLAAALLARAQATQLRPEFLTTLEGELTAAYAPKPQRGFLRWFGASKIAPQTGEWIHEREAVLRAPSTATPNQKLRNPSWVLSSVVGVIALLAVGVFAWAWRNRPTPSTSTLLPVMVVQPSTTAEFGGMIALGGYAVSASDNTPHGVVTSGATYSFTLQWWALQPISASYGVFVQLRAVSGEVIAQSDTPLSSAQVGQEQQTVSALSIPNPLPENVGVVNVYVGVYELATGQRLSLTKSMGVQQTADAYLLEHWTAQPAITQPVASAKAVLSPALKNARYVFENSPDYSIQLVDGKFERVDQVGTEPTVAITFSMHLLDQMDYGDLNGDGLLDAAVILHDDSSGYTLAPVLLTPDTARPLPAKQFGNQQIQIQAVKIDAGRIELSYDALGNTWAVSDTPQVHITHTFQLSSELLIEVGYTETLKFTRIVTDFPNSNIEAAAQPGSGHCEESYEQELGRTNLYYCAGGPFGRITGYPYCFLYADNSALLCVREPYGMGDVVRFERFGELPQPMAKFEGVAMRPWFVMLSDGTQCGRMAPLAERPQPALQIRVTYRCNDGNSFLLGELDTSAPTWKARKIRYTLGGYISEKDAREVEIATAWQ
jgi:hypothetical protein